LLSTALSTILASISPAMAQVSPVDEDLVKDGDLDSVMATLQPEFYCVFDVLSQSGAFQDIAAVWVAPDAEQGDIDSADAVLSDAVKECADSYDWSDDVKDFGATVGIHGSVVQVLTEEMLTAGVEEEQLQGVFDMLTDMDDADTQAFVDASWVEDYAFKKKMYRALVRFGLPNEDTALENSMLVLESSVMTADAIVKWLDVKDVDVSSAAAGTPPPAAGPPPSPRSRRPAEPALAGGPPWVRTTLPTGRGGAERRGGRVERPPPPPARHPLQTPPPRRRRLAEPALAVGPPWVRSTPPTGKRLWRRGGARGKGCSRRRHAAPRSRPPTGTLPPAAAPGGLLAPGSPGRAQRPRREGGRGRGRGRGGGPPSP
jgi:hypothetical protein